MTEAELEVGYRAMAADEAGESEALEWAEALIGDAADWLALSETSLDPIWDNKDDVHHELLEADTPSQA